ncbi:poly(3-hydroxyalkanoate) depolymerase [Kineococcus sp. NUM-3379]
MYREGTVQVGRNTVTADVHEGDTYLLLVNGVGGGRALWEPLRAALPPGIGTIAFDAPGCGASAPARYPLSIREQARIAAAVLEWAGVESADVLGFSFGGMVAQQLAHDAPQTVRRLVLVGTGVGVGSVPGSPLAYALLTVPHMADGNWLRTFGPFLFGGRVAVQPDLDALARRFAQPVDVLSYLGQLQAATLWSSLPWFSRLEQPVLVLAGDLDPLVPVANACLMASLRPRTELHVVRGGGHLVLLDSTEEVAEVLTGFLGTGTGRHLRVVA